MSGGYIIPITAFDTVGIDLIKQLVKDGNMITVVNELGLVSINTVDNSVGEINGLKDFFDKICKQEPT
jgi:hypothetical protein